MCNVELSDTITSQFFGKERVVVCVKDEAEERIITSKNYEPMQKRTASSTTAVLVHY